MSEDSETGKLNPDEAGKAGTGEGGNSNPDNTVDLSLVEELTAYYGDDYELAFPVLLRHAQESDVYAQFRLAALYEHGLGVEQDLEQAARWCAIAAERGHNGAQCKMGQCCEQGLGVPQDYAKAAEWYRRATEKWNAQAQNSLGALYEKGLGVAQDDEQAVHWYSKATEKKLAEGEFNLGRMHEYGRGVSQDYEQAFLYYHRAAMQEHARAQYKLGWIYQHAKGFPQDLEQAAAWYRKSARLGCAKAQYQLARFHAAGAGVEVSYVRAAQLHREAAEQGHAEAQRELAECYLCGLGGLARDSSQYVHWLTQAAENGSARAAAELGSVYLDAAAGLGSVYLDNEWVLTHRYDLALEWSRKAVEQGNFDAWLSLGLMHEMGFGVPVDLPEAARCYRKFHAARDNVHRHAAYPYTSDLKIADFFYQAQPPLQDRFLSMQMYSDMACSDSNQALAETAANRMAAARAVVLPAAIENDAEAQNLLGLMYHHGLGVGQNHERALHWFKLSALQGLADAQYNLWDMERWGEEGRDILTGWLQQAAVQGHAAAQCALGCEYLSGHRCIPEDCDRGRFWLEQAAVQGFAEAQYELGKLFEEGKNGIARDMVQAVDNYRKAAAQNNLQALFQMGWLHGLGKGVEKDRRASVAYYRKAADYGYPRAVEILRKSRYAEFEADDS
jgi:TPR repeat protein